MGEKTGYINKTDLMFITLKELKKWFDVNNDQVLPWLDKSLDLSIVKNVSATLV